MTRRRRQVGIATKPLHITTVYVGWTGENQLEAANVCFVSRKGGSHHIIIYDPRKF